MLDPAATHFRQSRRVVRCHRCAGSVLYDRLEEDWRCIHCGRVQEPTAGQEEHSLRAA